MPMRFSQFTVVCSFLLLLLSCRTSILPLSSLKDNKKNRAVMEFMEHYRTALQERSVEKILALVSSDYFDKQGTQDPSDDCDYTKLKEKIEKTFKRAKEIKFSYYVQRIYPKSNQLEVFYAFQERALFEFPSGEQWVSTADINRIVLRQKGPSLQNGFEAISGL